jgi:hypothetical protein
MNLQMLMDANPGFFFLVLGLYLLALVGIILFFTRNLRWALRKGMSEGIKEGIVQGAAEILKMIDERKKPPK